MARKEDRLMAKDLPRYQKIWETEASQDVMWGQLDEEPKEESNWFKQASDYIIGLIDNGKIDEAKDLLYGMWKLPRWWWPEMSPAMDSNTREWLRNASHELDVVRTWTPEEKEALGKAQLRHWALYPYSAIPDIAKDVVSIPVNAARNVYNTAADVYNAKVSENNAKKQAKKAESKKK